MSTMLSSMANSMIKILSLAPGSLTRNTIYLIMVADNPKITRNSTNPLLDAVDIVTDSLDTLKAEGVVRGGDVPGTLPRSSLCPICQNSPHQVITNSGLVSLTQEFLP
eukprot:TRINITY_DN22294_c0_g1_i1.p1 TRINITY_DN22294_c0_g1~~TRINITY_DN22294_c0_g1_i1.p1  ORF type:complete len:108 (-),score=15.25 TRINITY_DN22294_c0_g1_i1:19-342(-)